MADTGIARLFTHGGSQAVRLPKEFRLPGDRVRVRHVGDGVLLEPVASDLDAWFAELDRFADVPTLGSELAADDCHRSIVSAWRIWSLYRKIL